jgi:hypothetical protein
MNELKILQFIKESVKRLDKDECRCCRFDLDNELAIFVGWSDGFDKDDTTVIHLKGISDYAIEVGVKIRRDYDDADYEWLRFPADLFDVNSDLDAFRFNPAPNMTDGDYLIEIKRLLSTYQRTAEDHKKGLIRYQEW